MKNFKEFMEEVDSSDDSESSDRLAAAREKFASARGKVTSRSIAGSNAISKGGARLATIRYKKRESSPSVVSTKTKDKSESNKPKSDKKPKRKPFEPKEK